MELWNAQVCREGDASVLQRTRLDACACARKDQVAFYEHMVEDRRVIDSEDGYSLGDKLARWWFRDESANAGGLVCVHSIP